MKPRTRLLAVSVLAALLAAAAAPAAVIVVDCNHPRADDANDGTEAAPLKTIAAAARKAGPGDTVCVMEGKYDEVRRLTIHRRGDCDYSRAFGRGHVVRYNCFHGTRSKEIGRAHVDFIQTFDVNGEVAHDVSVTHNFGADFHQAFVGESDKPGTGSNWTFSHNVFWPTWGAWGLSTRGIPGVRSINNTYVGMRWFGVGIKRKKATGGIIRNDLFVGMHQAITLADTRPEIRNNLLYKTNAKHVPKADGNLINVDPLMADPERGNFRLKRGSPAIDAGTGGADIGALAWPNVYYVDPRHPAASDEHFGYPGRPFKTIAAALRMARAGETVLLRGGVYRQAVKPARAGVTLKAFAGENVVLSGADLITGWARRGEAWSAPLGARPVRLCRDGRPWGKFAYDAAAKRIVLPPGGDPRLHVSETLVRRRAIHRPEQIRIEGIKTVDTLDPSPTR